MWRPSQGGANKAQGQATWRRMSQHPSDAEAKPTAIRTRLPGDPSTTGSRKRQEVLSEVSYRYELLLLIG